MDRLRLLLSGHPALGVAMGSVEGEAMRVAEARKAADEAWQLAHASRYRELAALLTSVVPTVERAVRTVPGPRARELRVSLASMYLAVSAVLAKLDERDGAWLAADRASALAEGADDVPLLAATQYRMALALASGRHLDQARYVAERAVDALDPVDKSTPALLSVWGALHLVLAVLASRDARRDDVRRLLDVARKAAAQVGEGHNFFESEFGPANVEQHAVSVAVDLGDAGEALAIASEVDASGLSAERRARLLIDMARAYGQVRRPADALRALQDAERVAPEQVRDHVHVREVVRDLLVQAGRRPSAALREFAALVGVG
jgi:tetratricopeptide (TPR) repeat protein